MLPETIGERVAAELTGAAFVVDPNARRGGASEVRAHHHFDRQRRALLGDHDVRIRCLDDVIRNDVFGLLKPPRSDVIEQLTFNGQRAEHSIERADAIGHHDDASSIVGAVAVAHLSLVLSPETWEVRCQKWVGEGFVEIFVGQDGGDLTTWAGCR